VRYLADRLSALEQVLCVSDLGTRPSMPRSTSIRPLIRAIARKSRFAQIHLALLEGIDWGRTESLGRRSTRTAEPECLCVALPEASLQIEHPDAVSDHVYLAFDGLTAALVNMTDTLGRLIRRAYELPIEKERQANLFAIREECTTSSSLGLVLHDPQNTEWLRKVRDLRGRCQHNDVEDVLTIRGTYACRGEPIVDQEYSWRTPPQETPIVAYSSAAAKAARECVIAIVAAIEACPSDPTK
jgi:hypothetical protein